MASLRNKTLSGIFWAFLQKMGSRGIAFVVTIILARLLTPEDFGLIGMIMIFIQISQAIVEGGFNKALIQKKETDELDFSSVFWINLLVSLLLYGVVFFVAPSISKFYDQPILTQLIRVLSFVFIINAFSLVQEAQLVKAINFKTLMLVHLPSSIIGGAVSLIMAYWNFGVWSLLAFQLVTRFAYTVQIWIHTKWKPLFIFNWKRIKVLFSFGSKLLASRLLTTAYKNIYLIVIGKFYPAKSVGYYNNSFNFVSQPSNTIASVLRDVTFPSFSSIQDDNERLKKGYKITLTQIVFWLSPIYMIAGVLATPLFLFIFGEKWLPAVPYFQWLCIVGIMTPLFNFNLNIVDVKGKSGLHLRLQLFRRIIVISAIALFYAHNILALLVIQAADSIFAFLLFSHFGGKLIDYRLIEQIKDIFPMFLIAGLSTVSIYFMKEYLFYDLSNLVQLFGGFSAGIAIYGLICSLFKLEAYSLARDLVWGKVSRRLKK